MELLPPTQENIRRAAEVLQAGGIVAHATETCYGFACDIANQAAVARLFALKQRPHRLPVSALFESIEQAKLFVEWSPLAENLANEHLPGPLTLVLPLKAESTLFPTPDGSTTLGVRVSPHPVACALVSAFGGPVTTTSANIHSLPNPYSPEEIRAQCEQTGETPEIILDSHTLEKRLSSSVIDISGGSVEILRRGPLLF